MDQQTTIATDAPISLQFIDGASACTYELHILIEGLWPSRVSEGLIRNDANFPELRAKPSRDAPAAFRHAPVPPTNPWMARAAQPPSATSRPHREAQRSPPGTAASIRDRWFIIVWRRYPNGNGRPPCGFELGDRRVRKPTPTAP
ncbi:hypothetical protein EVAR_16452_1 [Eumeta japonica]|uniref:Uncharacterized protein n=1 Tax=Eumeta variegata TaxID=151549 RepID=A0A4C1ULM0_EUMVA|nr:hypothetical protein EVAR_16452_1 [Eumeta japonica]